MKLLLIFLFLAIFSLHSNADELSPQELDSLLAQADFVGTVQIQAGFYVEGKGAIYLAKVMRVLKGKPTSSIIFGPYSGHKLGYEYLVFLANSGETIQAHWSREFHTDGPKSKWISKHKILTDPPLHEETKENTILPSTFDSSASYFCVFHEGMSSMEIAYSTEFDSQAVRILPSYVIFPKSIERKFEDPHWYVRLRDLSEYLTRLANNRAPHNRSLN